MRHEKNWREFILSAVILAMMFTIVCLSFVIDDKNSEIEHLQRKIWNYQEKNMEPTQPNKFNDFEYLRKRWGIGYDDHR